MTYEARDTQIAMDALAKPHDLADSRRANQLRAGRRTNPAHHFRKSGAASIFMPGELSESRGANELEPARQMDSARFLARTNPTKRARVPDWKSDGSVGSRQLVRRDPRPHRPAQINLTARRDRTRIVAMEMANMMLERNELPGGFTVLDGGAIVAGAAVSAVHLRGVIDEPFTGPGWILAWATFALIALTAAGPFLFLFQRLQGRRANLLRTGELVWTVLGIPWIVTALIATGAGDFTRTPPDVLSAWLGIGLALSSLVSMTVLWSKWVRVDLARAAENFSGPWTNRVGLVLAVAWPLQCGMGLVVVG